MNRRPLLSGLRWLISVWLFSLKFISVYCEDPTAVIVTGEKLHSACMKCSMSYCMHTRQYINLTWYWYPSFCYTFKSYVAALYCIFFFRKTLDFKEPAALLRCCIAVCLSVWFVAHLPFNLSSSSAFFDSYRNGQLYTVVCDFFEKLLACLSLRFVEGTVS